jgi:hypothetical protein
MKDDDSGLIDLAAASQADPQASFRAQSTPLAAQGLFDEESTTHQAPMSAPPGAPFGAYGQPMQPTPTLAPPAPSLPAASLPPASLAPDSFTSSPVLAAAALQTNELDALPMKKKRSGTMALVLSSVVAFAAAAGGVFYFKSHKAAEVATTTTTPAAKPTATAVAKAETPAPTNVAPVAEAAPTAEPSMDPNNLPVAAVAAPRGKVAVAAKPAKGFAPAAPAPKADGPAKMTEKDLVAAPSGPGGDLGKAMQQEVGDTGKGQTAAAGGKTNTPTGNIPQKPSQGAVTGALGAVLPGARACLGPDDAISRASVVFGSSGAVESVNVSGSAAGKPAEACIKGALMKAKVQPFAEPSYTAPVTIRHN